jgi:light-regulated signal transduction histidine kinase (bacteriophytochrome)
LLNTLSVRNEIKMATERWTDDMLDRLVGTVNVLAEVSERNNRDIQALLNISQIHQQNIELVVTDIREMQAEVRGLQTENRRILDQFINCNGDNG